MVVGKRTKKHLLVLRGGSSSKSRPRQKELSQSRKTVRYDASACVYGPFTRSSAAGDVVLDCGANVGSFARMAAPVLGPRGTVYCLEPMPDVWAALKLNASIYQRWADKNGLQVAHVVPIQAGTTSSAAYTAVQRGVQHHNIPGPAVLSQQCQAPASRELGNKTVLGTCRCCSRRQLAGKGVCVLPAPDSYEHHVP